MRFLFLMLLYAAVAFFIGPFLPYWVMMLVLAIIGALIGGYGLHAFFSAALAVGLVWLAKSFWITWITDSPLPEMMADIIGVNGEGVLMVITGFIGFLMAGLSALTGNRFRKLFEKKQPYYYGR